MTQNPSTSGTSFDETDTPVAPQHAAYDDATPVTSAFDGGDSSPSASSVSTGTPGASTGAFSAGDNGQSTSVRDEAASVTSDAAQSGRQVADTAVSEVKDVVGEARSQLMTLMHQLRSEATGQASTQSDRAVQGLRELGDELRQMAASSGQNGLATDLAGQAADRVHSVAGWLDQRQPGEVLDEVRNFARRRPGTFLAAAAVVGLIGGRLTRGLTAGSGSSYTSGNGSSPTTAYGSSPATAYGSNGGGYAPASSTTFGTDPNRVVAGADPVEGVEGLEGREGVEYRQGLR